MRTLCLLALTLPCTVLCADQNIRKMDFQKGGGLLAQIVDSTEWKTSIYLHNMDSAVANVGMYFSDDNGRSLSLPIAGRSTSALTLALQPNQTVVLETDGIGSLKQGWAAFMTCDKNCADITSKLFPAKLGVFAVFRQRVPGRSDSEAVVPSEMAEQEARVVFDNRTGFQTGVALLNFLGGSIFVTIRDDGGNTLVTDTLTVAEDAKTVFVLGDKYPATAGKYGSIEFRGTGVVAMGLRFSPSGSFTSSHAVTIH